MYMACAFEVVFHNNDSHWCAMFDEEDLKEAEYGEDLDSYWTKCTAPNLQLKLILLAYGNELNYNISCILLNEILDIMNGKASGESELSLQTSKFRFAHAETIIPLATVLVCSPSSIVLTLPRDCTSLSLMKQCVGMPPERSKMPEPGEVLSFPHSLETSPSSFTIALKAPRYEKHDKLLLTFTGQSIAQ